MEGRLDLARSFRAKGVIETAYCLIVREDDFFVVVGFLFQTVF